MEYAILLILVFAGLAIAGLLRTRARAGARVRDEYARILTKEAKRDAIAGARSDRELLDMWEVWERQGWSRRGLLYAELLQRRKELGAQLSNADESWIQQADRLWQRGKGLPPIEGRVRG